MAKLHGYDYRLDLDTAPATEPVSLSEAKTHLRVSISDDDALIDALITAARRWCERLRNESFVTQTWKLYADNWPGGDTIPLPMGPVQSVTSVTYTDEDGNESTLSSSNYLVDTVSRPARIRLKADQSWPTVTLRELNAIVVTYDAGYGDNASDVPEEVVAAIKLLVGHLYENREATVVGSGITVTEVPLTVKDLLWMDRVKAF